MRLLSILKAMLERPLAQRGILGLTLLLLVPALFSGRTLDDYLLQSNVHPTARVAAYASAPWDLFAFVSDNQARTEWMRTEGILPWFSDPELSLHFMRPLSSLTHWLDHTLWTDWDWLMHLHSLLWFAAVVVLVARLYAHLIPVRWVAGLATLMFAVDDGHGVPAGWISNRNSLVCATFGLLSLLAYHRWRQEAWRAGAWWAPILLGLSLLGAEAGVATGALLLSYALFLDRGTLKGRLWRLMPSATVGLAWQLSYSLLGYGARHSGVYIDPGKDPMPFVGAVAERLPTLVVGLFAFPPSDLAVLMPSGIQTLYVVAGLVLLAGLTWLLRPLLRAQPAARFFALSTLLCLLPVCATFPTDRLLLMPSVGALALLAMWLGEWIEPGSLVSAQFSQPSLPDGSAENASSAAPVNPSALEKAASGRGWTLPLVYAMLVVHLLLAPLLLPLRTWQMAQFSNYIQALARTLPSDLMHGEQKLVLVNPPYISFMGYMGIFPNEQGELVPVQVRALTEGFSRVYLERVDERTLSVRPEGGFLKMPMTWLMRDPRRILPLMEPVRVEGMTVTVTAHTDDGRPAEALFRFDVPLEHADLRFMQWDGEGLVQWKPPVIGGRETLAGHDPRL